ncbi:hypothetical protein J6O48_08340 [bacterium]|nr:hypothetical protein [bacterium]
MIGQCNLQSRIEKLIENRTFPRFSILVGPKGSGKKTFANWIRRCMGQNELTISYEAIDVKIDTIREIIQRSYKIVNPTIYIIPDADGMSNAAKNALLKVTEEPPNNAYFIMTLEDENNTLETIRSRGTVFYMDRYTPDEIMQYITEKYGSTAEDNVDIFRSICDTPGDADILAKCGVKSFYDYVQLVVDNIAEVSLANAFKIPSKVALKEDAEGYDLRLFWKAFMKVCTDKADVHSDPEDISRYGEAVLVTSMYLQKLRTKGINRSMLMDSWVLEIRVLWSMNRGLKNV